MADKNTQNNAKPNNTKLLLAYHYRAIELRYNGATSADISLKLQEEYDVSIHPGNIRHWFSAGKNGFLREQYQDYVEKMVDWETEQAKSLLKGSISMAVKALLNNLAKPGPSSVMASKEILERVLGKQEDKAPAGNTTNNITQNNFDINNINILDLPTPQLLAVLEAVRKLDNKKYETTREKPNNSDGDE